MKIFTRLDKVAEAVKGYNLDVMPDNTSATLQQVNKIFLAHPKLQYRKCILTFWFMVEQFQRLTLFVLYICWQGGVYVFEGAKVLYARKDEATGDHSNIEDILNSCCRPMMA